jgi:protein-S-isoprenylcysteine O-methyltransferase Ste14
MPVYIILQLIFFATEVSLLLFKRSKTTVKNSRDKRSLLILWVVIVTGSTLGPDISAHGIWSMTGINVTYAGIAVFAIGFIIRWSAVIQLGKMFTVDVAIVDKHSLKTSGLYKIVRHPSYLGLILIIIGLALCLNNWLSLLVMIIPDFTAINYRISVEEKALTEQFGEQYTTYKTRVKKLVPYIY